MSDSPPADNRASAEGEQASPLRSVGRHTLVYGSGYVAASAASLVLVPLYTHYFTPAEFGLLALMLILYGIGKQVYDLGFTNSVARFYFDDERDGSEARLYEMQATSLAFLALWAGSLTAGLWLFAGSWSDLLTGTARHADLVRIVAATLFAETMAIVPLTLIRMRQRSGVFLAVTLVRVVTSLVLGVVFVAVLDWGVAGALAAIAVPAGAILVLLLVLDGTGALTGGISAPLLRQMLTFGLPFLPVLLAGWVIDASDRYLLELLRTREEVGLYNLAYRVAAVMQIAIAAFMMGWAPLRDQIYRRPGAEPIYRRLTSTYVVAASLIAVGLALLADQIVAVVAPSSYASAAGVIPLIVLAYVLQGLYFLMVTGMGVTKQTAPLAWIAVAGAALNIGVNLLVIPEFGMEGAAVTTVFAYAVMVFGTWRASQRVYPIPYDWQRMAQVTGVAVVVVAAVAVASLEGLAGVTCALLAWAAFALLLVRTGAIDDDDLRIARQWARELGGRA